MKKKSNWPPVWNEKPPLNQADLPKTKEINKQKINGKGRKYEGWAGGDGWGGGRRKAIHFELLGMRYVCTDSTAGAPSRNHNREGW